MVITNTFNMVTLSGTIIPRVGSVFPIMQPIQVMLIKTDRLLLFWGCGVVSMLLVRFVHKDIVHKEHSVVPGGIDDLAVLLFFV